MFHIQFQWLAHLEHLQMEAASKEEKKKEYKCKGLKRKASYVRLKHISIWKSYLHLMCPLLSVCNLLGRRRSLNSSHSQSVTRLYFIITLKRPHIKPSTLRVSFLISFFLSLSKAVCSDPSVKRLLRPICCRKQTKSKTCSKRRKGTA